jgi:hypothetical protein
MASRTKRHVTKIGNSTKTVTHSNRGTRVTISNKPSKDAPRRTLSTNLKTGKSRLTNSYTGGGGYRNMTSKTFGGSVKPRKTRFRKGTPLHMRVASNLFVNRIDTSEFKWWQKILWYVSYPFLVITEFLLTMAFIYLMYAVGIALIIGLIYLIISILT